MSMLTLDVAPREVIGKKVKVLRREGYIPGIIYGPKAENPAAVQVEWKILRPVLQTAGGTGLIDLNLDGKTISVLVTDVHRHPVRSEEVLHIDFYAVDVNATLNVTVPIVVPSLEAIGKRLETRAFQPIKSIDVECLPANIPSEIVVDPSVLKEPGDAITVADLPELEGVTYLQESDSVIVRTLTLAALEAVTADPDAEEGEGLEGSVEPEVIGRGAEEEGEDF